MEEIIKTLIAIACGTLIVINGLIGMIGAFIIVKIRDLLENHNFKKAQENLMKERAITERIKRKKIENDKN